MCGAGRYLDCGVICTGRSMKLPAGQASKQPGMEPISTLSHCCTCGAQQGMSYTNEYSST